MSRFVSSMVTIMEQKAPCALPVCHHVGEGESNPPNIYGREYSMFWGLHANCPKKSILALL